MKKLVGYITIPKMRVYFPRTWTAAQCAEWGTERGYMLAHCEFTASENSAVFLF